jgi:hypothetical protein
MSELIKHAKSELQRVGLFDKDSDYDGELGNGVFSLIKMFALQGHSGYSAEATIHLFTKLARFEKI